MIASMVAAAIVGLVLAALPSSPTPYAERVGVSSHVVRLPAAEGYRYLERARRGGIRWVREDFDWRALEPRPGRYDWRRTDALMRSTARLRIKVLAVVLHSPRWASGQEDYDYPPRDPATYARFVKAVANRYGAKGAFWRAQRGLRPEPLAAIEIWNEPWSYVAWRPEPDVVRYAALAKRASAAIKSVHPELDVLVSGDLHLQYADGRDYGVASGRDDRWEVGFLTQLLRQDFGAANVDGYSVHPYAGSHDPYEDALPTYADPRDGQQWLYRQVTLIRDMLKAAGKPKPLWSTEVGWSTGVPPGQGTAQETTEAKQAEYLRGALRRAVVEWRSFVARSFVYVWEKPRGNSWFEGYSLLRPDGTAKPAWRAVKRLIATGT